MNFDNLCTRSLLLYLAHVHKLRIKLKNVEFPISEFDVNCFTLLFIKFTFQLMNIRVI